MARTTNTLSVKFTTEGFEDLRRQMSQASKSFESALEKAKQKSREAIQAGQAAADGTKEQADAYKQLESAARSANSAIAGAFRELRVKSTADIEAQKVAAISAYNAIKNSGTASAKDIRAADKQLKEQLAALDAQLEENAVGWEKLKIQGRDALEAIKTKLTTLDLGVRSTGEGFTVLKGVLANLISSGIQAGLSAIASTLQKITSGIMGFAQSSVGVFMSFDGAMKAFMAKSGGATEAQIKAVREETERLGMATSKTPTQIAQMAASLAGAGFSADETKDSLAGIVMAAEASGESLETVGSIVGAAINQFRLEAKDSQYIADVLTAGANASATSISGLGEGLKYIGAIAGGANQSIEDMTIVLGLLTNAGLEAGQAGRNFASAFERLEMASAGISDGTNEGTAALKAQQEALRKLGVEFRQADGQMRPFLEVLPELAEQFNKLSFEDQATIRKQLFGTEGGRAIVALLSQIETKLGSVTNAVRNAHDIGAAAVASEQLMKGLGPALELLQSSIEVFQKNIGEAIAPAMEFIVRATTGWVNELVKTEGLLDPIKNLSEEIKNFFEQNPAIIESINQEMTALVQDALQGAAGLAQDLFNFLKENPTAIADAIKKMGEFVGGFLQVGVNLAQSLLGYLDDNPDAIGSMMKSMEGFLIVLGKAVEGAVKLGEAIADAAKGWEFYNSPISSYKRAIEKEFGPASAALLQDEYNRLEREQLDKYMFSINSPLGTLKGDAAQKIAEEAYNNVTQQLQQNKLLNLQYGTPGEALMRSGLSALSQGGVLSKPGKTQLTFNQNDFKQSSGFVFPVPGGSITGDQGDGHRGLDVFAPVGTPILASLPGTVVQAMEGGTKNKEDSNPNKPGYQAQHSVKVKLDTPIQFDGKTINYYWNTHLTELAPGLKVGSRVNAGDVLGKVGMAGGAAHLHQAFGETENFRGNNPLSNRESLELLTAIKQSSGATPRTQLASNATPPASASTASSGISAANSKGQAIVQAASVLGINPLDLATIIEFESSGEKDKWNKKKTHRGLIQFGEEERRKYGYSASMSFEEQVLGPVVRYFQDRFKGVGMSTQGADLLTLYRTVLGGNPKASLTKTDSNQTSPQSGVAMMTAPGKQRDTALNKYFGGTAPSSATSTANVNAEATKQKKQQEEQAKQDEAIKTEALKRRQQEIKIADQNEIIELKAQHDRRLDELKAQGAADYEIRTEQNRQKLELEETQSKQAIAQLKRELADLGKESREKAQKIAAGEEVSAKDQARNIAAEMEIKRKEIAQQERRLAITKSQIERDQSQLDQEKAKSDVRKRIDETAAEGTAALDSKDRKLQSAIAKGELSRSDITQQQAELKAARLQIEIDKMDQQLLEGLVNNDAAFQRQLKSLKEQRDELIKTAEFEASRQAKAAENAQSNQATKLEIEAQRRKLDLLEKTKAIGQEDLLTQRALLDMAEKQLEIQQLQQALEIANPDEKPLIEQRLAALQDELSYKKANLEFDLQQLDLQKQIKSEQTDMEILSQKIALAQRLGLEDKARELQLLEAQKKLEQDIADIKQRGVDPTQETQLIQLAKGNYLQTIKEINGGVFDLGSTIDEVARGPLEEFFQTMIQAPQSIGDAWQAMAQSILQGIAQIAAEIATSELMKLLNFGGNSGGGLIDSLFAPATSAATSAIGGVVGGMPTPFMGAKVFAEGGYTGDGGKYDPAGIVHAGEYVMPKDAVKRIGIPALEALKNGLTGYAKGGLVLDSGALLSSLNTRTAPMVSIPAMSGSANTTTSNTNTITVNINDKNSRFYTQPRTLARELVEELRRG